MSRNSFIATLLCLAACIAVTSAQGDSCSRPAPCGCAPAYMTTTILVPKLCAEYRPATFTEFVPEMRERFVTVRRFVPVTTMVHQECEVMIARTAYRSETYCVQRPIWKDETHEHTELVPYIAMREQVRTVRKQIPAVERRIVCVDRGHWTKLCPDACHSCGRCTWVPNKVYQQIEVAVLKPVLVQETHRHPITLCRTATRTSTTRCLVGYELEQRVRQVPYTECVPVIEKRSVPVTTCKEIDEELIEPYCVLVPRTVTRQVRTYVCKLVPQTVTVPVASCGNCSRN